MKTGISLPIRKRTSEKGSHIIMGDLDQTYSKDDFDETRGWDPDPPWADGVPQSVHNFAVFYHLLHEFRKEHPVLSALISKIVIPNGAEFLRLEGEWFTIPEAELTERGLVPVQTWIAPKPHLRFSEWTDDEAEGIETSLVYLNDIDPTEFAGILVNFRTQYWVTFMLSSSVPDLHSTKRSLESARSGLEFERALLDHFDVVFYTYSEGEFVLLTSNRQVFDLLL